MTRQRALILGIMREKCPEHLTADEIFSHARQAMPHIAPIDPPATTAVSRASPRAVSSVAQMKKAANPMAKPIMTSLFSPSTTESVWRSARSRHSSISA